jgi:hypothetical protein
MSATGASVPKVLEAIYFPSTSRTAPARRSTIRAARTQKHRAEALIAEMPKDEKKRRIPALASLTYVESALHAESTVWLQNALPA